MSDHSYLGHDIYDALPEQAKRYIMELETRVDPAGDVAELANRRDQVQQLETLVTRLRVEIARWRDTSEGWRQKLVQEKDEANELRKTIGHLRSDLAYKDTELADVRHQHKTLKCECAVLSEKLRQARELVVANGAEADRLEAEVERRGEMLKKAANEFKGYHMTAHEFSRLTKRDFDNGAVLSEIRNSLRHREYLIMIIESLDTAPATSTSSTGADCPADD